MQLGVYCGGRPEKDRLPVASECNQEPKTEDAKEVAKASIELTVSGICKFLKKAGNAETSASVRAGGIQWQLRVSSATDNGGRAQLGCSLEGAHADGAWSRWLAADFFVFDQEDWRKLGGVREKLIGSEPLPCSAGEPSLVSAQRMDDTLYSYIDKKNDSARFRVDFACWRDSFQTKGDFDDVAFIVEGRPVYANKGYITYISPVLRAMLTGNFKEGQSDQLSIKQTSAEDFVTLMRAVAPVREPVTDSNVQALYGLADVYDVEFLRRECEKHLLAMDGIEAARLVGSLSSADLEEIQDEDREDELSEEVKEQLREREKLLAEV